MTKNKPYAITLDPGSSLANKTGSWRTERPVYVDRLPPCNHECPAGENIQQWLYYAEEGDYEKAWRIIMEDNPMPAVLGRVCYHPCEVECNRGKLDEPVNIHAVERFLGDFGIEKQLVAEAVRPPSGKRVLVVGGGPSGLSAAYHLTRLGHDVTVYEAGPHAGGMMRFGIPTYRLPRDVLDAEILRIQKMGVSFVFDRPVANLAAELEDGAFDTGFVAVGAHISKRTEIPARDAGTIYDALHFLEEVEAGSAPLLGQRVAVYGGGNTAIDTARTARRLGASEALIVYRRTRDMAPAKEEEIADAEEEGIKIHWLSTIKQIDESEYTIEKMELDESGWPQPTGEFESLEADSLILALGQDVDTSFLKEVKELEYRDDGSVVVNDQMMTGREGLFAGGDMVPDERTVTTAIGHGKKAARCIDAYLRGSRYESAPKHELAEYETLNTWYYTEADKSVQPILDQVRRRSTFEEVVGGLDEKTALLEARRCLSCGSCFECDNCFGICPDNAVLKLGGGEGYEFNYDFCKGCALCVVECPSGAIQMEPESI